MCSLLNLFKNIPAITIHVLKVTILTLSGRFIAFSNKQVKTLVYCTCNMIAKPSYVAECISYAWHTLIEQKNISSNSSSQSFACYKHDVE